MKNNFNLIIYLFCSVILPVLFFLNWQWPLMRLTVQVANYGVYYSVLMLAIAGGLRAIAYTKAGNGAKPVKAILISLYSVFLGVWSILLLLSLIFMLPSVIAGNDREFEKIHQLDKDISIYRTNGGATMAYGIIVRQEKPLVLGLMLVNELFNGYPMQNINFAWDKNILILSDPDQPGKSAVKIVVE